MFSECIDSRTAYSGPHHQRSCVYTLCISHIRFCVVDRFNDDYYSVLCFGWILYIKIKYGFKLFGCVFFLRRAHAHCSVANEHTSRMVAVIICRRERASEATWWYCNWWICSSFYTMSPSYVDQHISWFLCENFWQFTHWNR